MRSFSKIILTAITVICIVMFSGCNNNDDKVVSTDNTKWVGIGWGVYRKVDVVKCGEKCDTVIIYINGRGTAVTQFQ